MNILLVNPYYDMKRYMGGLSPVGWVFPPIGLLSVASYVRSKDSSFCVKVYDSQVEAASLPAVLAEFRPDVVGITCQSSLVYSALEAAKLVKEAIPAAFVVIGGVHATLRPQDLMNSENVDVVVRGEGEEAFAEICGRIKQGEPVDKTVLGITYREAGEIKSSPERCVQPNLDKYPMPALDLIPLEKYRISPDMRTGSRLGVIMTSRGCPYNCTFCANKLITKGTYRIRSLSSVIDEIEYYLEKYNINQLMIYDDNFAVNRKRTIELCNEFIRRGYPKKFTWWAETRIDNIDSELLSKMRDAGCEIISLGLESGNQRLLDMIKKRITLEETRKKVAMIKASGIKIRASFILGLPTETREESLNTIKFAYSLPLDQVRFAIATPFPGTELWDIAVKEGRINPEKIDWTKLSLMSGYANYLPVYYPKGRTPEEIARLQRRANLGFFLRPRIIFGYIKRIKSPSDLVHTVRGLFYLVKSTIS